MTAIVSLSWVLTKDAHVAAVVSTTGKLIDCRSFPATADSYQQLLEWARSSGMVSRAGVECTGSYGAALSRFLRTNELTAIEVNQPDKAVRRRRGKTDTALEPSRTSTRRIATVQSQFAHIESR